MIERRKYVLIKCGIYSITNKLNNKKYIGQSVNIDRRLSQHKNHLRKGIHCNPHLQNSWNKYGEDNFEFKILELCDRVKLDDMEEMLMDKYDAFNNTTGYNIMPVIRKNKRTTIRRYECFEDDYFDILEELDLGSLTIRQIADKYEVSIRLVSDISKGSFKIIDCAESSRQDANIRRQHLYKMVSGKNDKDLDISIEFIENMDICGFNPSIFWYKYDKAKAIESMMITTLKETEEEFDLNSLERDDKYDDVDPWTRRALEDINDELREEYGEFAMSKIATIKSNKTGLISSSYSLLII